MKLSPLLIAIWMLILFTAATLNAATDLTPDLLERINKRRPNDKVPVIIEMNDQVVLPEAVQNLIQKRPQLLRLLQRRAEITQRLLAARLKAVGAEKIVPFWIFNGLSAHVPAGEIKEIARVAGIRQIRLERVFTLQVTSGVGFGEAEWNIDMVRARELWAMGYTGQGVVVANMDTGVDVNHPDLTAGWRSGANSWFDAFDPTTTQPRDGDGHGTATMSLIVGGNAGGTHIGMAPGAQWIAAKVFDDNRQATTTTLHQGFQWLLDPDGNPSTHDAPDVVNNSWIIETIDQCDTEFEADVQALKALGVAVVFSAGNYGPGTATSVSPANYPESFSVGAVDDGHSIAPFSSRGPSACPGTSVYPQVVAPGTSNGPLTFGVKTAYRFGTYLYQEGTSFAAPHVAGAMALLIDAFPNVNVHQLEAAIKEGALDLGPNGPDDDYGHGLLDTVLAHVDLRCPNGGKDKDRDGIPDTCDNCTTLPNPKQRDTDGDGYGNFCDTDLNNSGVTDYDDFYLFTDLFGSNDRDADFNGDGIVDLIDFSLLRYFFNMSPGPSGLAQ